MVEENIVQNQIINQATEIQSQPAKPWLKIVLFSVLGVGLVGGLVLAGIQIGKRQTQVTSPPTPTPSLIATPTPIAVIPTQIPLPTSTPMPTLTPGPTANWKTYSAAGISFKYPPNWVYKKFDIPGRAELHGLVQLMPENYESDIPMMPLFIMYWDNPEGLTIEQFDKKINQGAAMLYPLYNSKAQLTTLANLTAQYEPKGDCSPFPCHKYVISIQNKIWEISSQYTNNPNEFKPTIDLILSTFRFLD